VSVKICAKPGQEFIERVGDSRVGFHRGDRRLSIMMRASTTS
jgi:hypothetical protein